MKQALPHTLKTSFQQAHGLLDQLLEVLQQELAALETQDNPRLSETLATKTDLLSALEHNASERSQLMLEAGFSADTQGLEELLNNLPANLTAELNQAWQALEQQLEACKAANAVNAKVVHRSRQQTDSLLALLRGQVGNAQLYSASGAARPLGGQQPLARA